MDQKFIIGPAVFIELGCECIGLVSGLRLLIRSVESLASIEASSGSSWYDQMRSW